MKNNGLSNLMYSAGGVIVLFIILLAVNFIVRAIPGRADLTHGNSYTLSDGTKRILEKIPAPVKVRFYASKSETAMPVQVKTYAKRIEDLLNEYKARSGGIRSMGWILRNSGTMARLLAIVKMERPR